MISEIGEVLKLFSRAIVPPMDADPKAQFWYRVRVAAVACMAFTWTCVFTAAALGYVPGFDGFVRTHEMTELRSSLLDSEIFNTRVHECQTSDGHQREMYARRVDELMTQFLSVAHYEHRLASCNDLLNPP